MRAVYRIALFLCLVLKATAIPNGEFLIGDSSGEKFRELLTFRGTGATLMRLEEDGTPLETPIPMEVHWQKDGLCLLSSTPADANIRLFASFKSDNEALVWYSGDHRVYWALRMVDDVLAPLQGDWGVLSEGGPLSGRFQGKTLELKRQNPGVTLELSPVWAETKGTIRAVARRPSGASYLLSFTPITPSLWLAQNPLDTNGLMLYREPLEPWFQEELKLRLEDEGARGTQGFAPR